MTTAEKIISLRKSAGLTQKQLAEKLGLKQQKISEYENGIYEPKYKTMMEIIKLCKAKR
jgi:transcriptional regulator with XRE-family HTH domain